MGCLSGLRGFWAGLLLLRGVDWSLLRATSFSVRAKMGTVFLYRWTWSYRQLISRVGWWARWTLGLRIQSLDMLLLILWMVSGWRSFLGSRVDMTTLLLGKVVEAFSITPLSDSDTLSCWLLRSLEPVWMMMWLGDPSCSSDSRSMACWVFGHQILATVWVGKSLFSSMNLPLESMRMTMSGFPLCCAGLEG